MREIVIPLYIPLRSLTPLDGPAPVHEIRLSHVPGNPGLEAIFRATDRIMCDHGESAEAVLVGSDVWKECKFVVMESAYENRMGVGRQLKDGMEIATSGGYVRVYLDPGAEPDSVRCILPERVATRLAFGGGK